MSRQQFPQTWNPYELPTQYLQFLLFSSTFNKRFLIAVREPEGSSFARHINLQLTYSFQNNAQNPMHLNGSKAGLYPTHGKKSYTFGYIFKDLQIGIAVYLSNYA